MRTESILNVKDGDVVRYHSITTREDFVRVRIDGAPYAVGSGDMVCRAVDVETGRVHYPWLGALTVDAGPARAPQKQRRRSAKATK